MVQLKVRKVAEQTSMLLSMKLVTSVLLVVFAIVLAGCGTDSQSQNTPVSAPVVTSSSPSPKTVSPTPHPTQPLVTHGPTVLGQPFSNFVGKYGHTQITSNDRYTWVGSVPNVVLGATVKGGMVVRVDLVNLGEQWSRDKAISECGAFLPQGAALQTSYPDQGAYDYTSSKGDILLMVENDFGDCFVEFAWQN